MISLLSGNLTGNFALSGRSRPIWSKKLLCRKHELTRVAPFFEKTPWRLSPVTVRISRLRSDFRSAEPAYSSPKPVICSEYLAALFSSIFEMSLSLPTKWPLNRRAVGGYCCESLFTSAKQFSAAGACCDRLIMTPNQDHFVFSEDALSLRAALAFDPKRAQAYVESGVWRDDTLRSWLQRNAQRKPNAQAVIFAGGVVTYSELEQRVAKIAAGLHGIGVRPGDVVAVQLPNTLEYIESFLAISFLGAVMTTLYLSFRGAELAAQLVHSRAKAMIAPDAIGEFRPPEWALQNRALLPRLANIVVVGEAPAGTIGFEALGNSAAALPTDLPIPDASDPFLLLYTSGTTANPKGVPLNYHQMLTNARFGIGEHDIRPDDIVLSAAPFGHLYALYTVQMALCVGASTLLLPVFTPPEFIKTIETKKPTHLFAGAAHIAACQGAGLLDFTETFIAARRCFVGGCGASRSGSCLRTVGDKRKCRTALGHDRIAGRLVYASRRSCRDSCKQHRTRIAWN